MRHAQSLLHRVPNAPLRFSGGLLHIGAMIRGWTGTRTSGAALDLNELTGLALRYNCIGAGMGRLAFTVKKAIG